MSIELVSTNIEGMYAIPRNHPSTCANPIPWKICWIKLEFNSWSREITNFINKIWIRGKDDTGKESIWFRVDHCWIGPKDEIVEYIKDVRG